ncbi:MAG: lamin tail domain-containing protein [Saprospiraceae bacterium]|nr:lamin tail domain-containing protein [Saprospiraceae bacterium]
MLRICILLIFTFLCRLAPAYSQIIDDFSDGNFNLNPMWTGDVSAFTVNTASELQLNTAAAGSSMLKVQGNIPDSAVWNLRFKLNFSPSGQNLLRIYLLADQQDLTQANGYFLEIGETGSQDALRFFRQDAGVKTLIATGQAALVATNPNIQLRVKKSVSGNWTVEAAPPASALQPQFVVSDATFSGGADRFFGFQCLYTASNIANFFFDDISILPDLPDVAPPVLLSATPIDEQQVMVIFDEDLDPVSTNLKSNYSFSGGVGEPQSAFLQSDNKSVLLNLNTLLATGNYTLQTNGIKDVTGNTSLVQTVDFQYVKIETAEEFDLVINEIMADPSPSIGLPDLEWLELLNRSDKIIDLSTLRIADGSSAPLPLPAHLMYPGTRVVLTAAANVAALSAVTADTVLAGPLSASALNNEDDVLVLSHVNGHTIDRVAYSVEWHTEPGKDDGGWSLERVNPDLPCLGEENWRSCPVLPGGTPGAVNAAFEQTTDTRAPRLLYAFPESGNVVVLVFSEGLDKNTAQNTQAYRFIPSRAIQSAQTTSDPFRVQLTLSEPLQETEIYALLLQSTVLDCSGNAFSATDTCYTGLPEKPEYQDVVVNEILFNPPTNGFRYVELYNRSQKIFKWSSFFVINLRDVGSVEAVVTEQLLLPGKYQVFTTNRKSVLDRFRNIHADDVLRQALPGLSDDEDNFTLYWSENGQITYLDSLNYVDDWHNGLFSSSDRDGVALERIRTASATNDPANWTSASPLLTGAPGTPTLPNSQRLGPVAPVADDELILLPVERLSPDDDGYEDFLEIYYQLPQEGYGATLTIFDSGGIPVKRLVRQELIGTEGTLRWDGDADDGGRVRPGIYVLFLEVFSPTGDVKNIKRSVSVVRRF